MFVFQSGYVASFHSVNFGISVLNELQKRNWVLTFDVREKAIDPSYVIKNSRLARSATVLKRRAILNLDGSL